MNQALFVLLFLLSVLFVAAGSPHASASSRSYEELFGHAYTNHQNLSRDIDAGPGVNADPLGAVTQNPQAVNA